MGSTAAEIKKHVQLYMMVFGALLVLTGVTVGVAYLDVGILLGIVIALFVASIKGTLVACYFMHLLSERGMLYWILALCALFFLILLLLPVITTHDNPMAGFVDPVSGK